MSGGGEHPLRAQQPARQPPSNTLSPLVSSSDRKDFAVAAEERLQAASQVGEGGHYLIWDTCGHLFTARLVRPLPFREIRCAHEWTWRAPPPRPTTSPATAQQHSLTTCVLL